MEPSETGEAVGTDQLDTDIEPSSACFAIHDRTEGNVDGERASVVGESRSNAYVASGQKSAVGSQAHPSVRDLAQLPLTTLGARLPLDFATADETRFLATVRGLGPRLVQSDDGSGDFVPKFAHSLCPAFTEILSSGQRRLAMGSDFAPLYDWLLRLRILPFLVMSRYHGWLPVEFADSPDEVEDFFVGTLTANSGAVICLTFWVSLTDADQGYAPPTDLILCRLS